MSGRIEGYIKVYSEKQYVEDIRNKINNKIKDKK
jgi:hypothetical protein